MALPWDDADPLPTDVPTLHAMVRDLRTELTAVRAELAAVNAKLDKLLAVTFGRSERAKRPRTPPPVADPARGTGTADPRCPTTWNAGLRSTT